MANMHPDLAAATGINVDAGQDAFLRHIRRQPPAWFIAVCKGARAPRGKPEPNSPAVWDGPPLLGNVENSGKGKGKAANGCGNRSLKRGRESEDDFDEADADGEDDSSYKPVSKTSRGRKVNKPRK